MSNQIYGPPQGGCCPHGQMYSPCPECLKEETKLYVPCNDCMYDEGSTTCQRCEFEQTLNENLDKDEEIERLKDDAEHYLSECCEIAKLCGVDYPSTDLEFHILVQEELSQLRTENERLRKERDEVRFALSWGYLYEKEQGE